MKSSILTTIALLGLVGPAVAQEHQHHPGGAPAPQTQPQAPAQPQNPAAASQPQGQMPMSQMMQNMPEQCRAMMQNMPQGCMSMMQQTMHGGATGMQGQASQGQAGMGQAGTGQAAQGGHAGHHAIPPATAQADTPATLAFRDINARMHRDMDIRYTNDIDVDFVRNMIPHHLAAVEMAKVVLRHSQEPETRKLAEDVVRAQESEIAQMRAFLKKKGAE
jgi:uncharacterized protein (DUF305 family)